MFGGIVIPGDNLGKGYGYPTANLKVDKKEVELSTGVYAAYASLSRRKYKAALAIKEQPWKVEVYLLDYQGGDFYGAYLEVEPVQKVSEIQEFTSQDSLVKKIEEDMRIIEKILTYTNPKL